MTMSNGFRGCALAAFALTLTACGGHHLADYQFHGRTIAVVPLGAPAPEIWTGDHEIDTDQNPLITVIEAGSAVAVHLEARRARARLDSAAVRVDMDERIARRTFERSARYLGTRRIDDAGAADYVMEIDVERFGINASGGNATLFVEGEAILLDGRTGREIWNQEVSAWDQLTPSISGAGAGAAGGVLTAAALSTITVAEYERILEQLADYAGDVMTEELREDLRAARD